jgi:hypothetical protein
VPILKKEIKKPQPSVDIVNEDYHNIEPVYKEKVENKTKDFSTFTKLIDIGGMTAESQTDIGGVTAENQIDTTGFKTRNGSVAVMKLKANTQREKVFGSKTNTYNKINYDKIMKSYHALQGMKVDPVFLHKQERFPLQYFQKRHDGDSNELGIKVPQGHHEESYGDKYTRDERSAMPSNKPDISKTIIDRFRLVPRISDSPKVIMVYKFNRFLNT